MEETIEQMRARWKRETAEREAIAMTLVAQQDALDMDTVEAHWDDYGPAKTKALYAAGEFIAMFDALTAIREDQAAYERKMQHSPDEMGGKE
jgi:hypothetical protein